MNTRLKLAGIVLFRKCIDTIAWIVRGIGRTVQAVLLRPIFGIFKFFYQLIFFRLYKLYILTKKQISTFLLPAKNKVLFLFSTRYALHSLLLIIALLVITENVSAREIRPDEVGKHSRIQALVPKEIDTEIIEVSGDNSTISGIDILATEGNLTSEEQFTANIQPSESDDATITQEGAIVKPDIASTTIGDRPNSEVTYHIVQAGETISQIANQYKVSVATILGENQIREDELIKPGQKLTILPVTEKFGDSATHRVNAGESLSAIAKKYKTDVETLIAFNNLVAEDAINEGDILIIPGVAKEPPAPPKPTPRSRLAEFFGGGGEKPASGGAGASTKLRWPTTGTRLNQRYRYGHKAVDIGSPKGAPVYAADDGVVTNVSWIKYGYGHHIVINHGNGIQTLYSHNDQQFVKVGQRVSRGETIATIGLTGRTTGYHVHFEVMSGGVKVNPLNYLY
ncbi:MAG: peptidoglycan DD-metalloendopeptidase family protein [Candidatus Kerfeldbacteria bacterium]|nr:peptidoglycan DD-metalloendopeptidase family protein [Candidatus Kerfeldbacteria bacterium]